MIAGTAGVLQVVEHRVQVIADLLTQGRNPLGIPARRREVPARGLELAVRVAAHRFHAQELIQDRQHSRLTAIAFDETRKGILGTAQRQYRGLSQPVLEVRVGPPTGQHALDPMVAAGGLGCRVLGGLQQGRDVTPGQARQRRNARGIRAWRVAEFAGGSHEGALHERLELAGTNARFQQQAREWLGEATYRGEHRRFQRLAHPGPLRGGTGG